MLPLGLTACPVVGLYSGNRFAGMLAGATERPSGRASGPRRRTVPIDISQWRRRVTDWRGRVSHERESALRHKRQGTSRTAFVLLGGGARGAAQAGALTVLLSRGIRPDFIVGISAGAWNGAYLAQDPTVERARELEGLWSATTSHDVIGRRRWVPAINAIAFRSALYGGEGMRRVARRYLQDRTFADTRVPLRILATDLATGEARLFNEGPLLSAVLASSAMPGIFPPVSVGGGVFVDGGIVEWAGCAAAVEWGATRVCLVGCGAAALPVSDKQQAFLRVFERSWEAGIRSNFDRTVFALRAVGTEVIAVLPRLGGGSMLDFDRAAARIEAGRAAAEVALADWASQAGVAPHGGVARSAPLRVRAAMAEVSRG